jgi:DNA-binding CsgD family transcriptional regulator
VPDEAEPAPVPADTPVSDLDRAQPRAPATKRRRVRIERREAYFDLLASGYSYRQIAEAMKVTPLSVRRAVDRAIAERRLDAPDRYVHLQVARLSKALRAADMGIEKGDLKAVAPFVRVVAELDRYHGLGVRYQRRLDARSLAALAADAPQPLALAHAPADADPAKVSESDP